MSNEHKNGVSVAICLKDFTAVLPYEFGAVISDSRITIYQAFVTVTVTVTVT
jgi:hypothetical protein